MATIKMGTNFPAKLAKDVFSKVKGHSSIAKMVPSQPVAFTGTDVFTFSLDKNISIVGEGGAKPAGDATLTPVQIRPIKVVYQSRVSDEFLTASEEEQINVLESFADGFAKKVASGMDEMIMHGVNPYDGNASATIGDNCLDEAIDASHVITYGHDSTAADTNIDEALALVDDPNGIILGKTIRSAIAALTVSGAKKYPEFAWGATPADLGGMAVDTNKTVESNSADARAYVGDWNALRWGFAKELPIEVIEFGNPDGGTYDLKRSNEVLIRSEAFIGWGILDANAFAEVAVSGES